MARVGAIDLAAFGPVYREAVRDIAPFLTPDRLEVIARHNPGWRPEHSDAVAYLETSEARYSAAPGPCSSGTAAMPQVVTLNYTSWPASPFWRRIAADWPRRLFGSLREVLLACASRDGRPSD